MEFPFATKRYLASGIEKYGWEIGDHTYGNPSIMEETYGAFKIGRFCSIASNVTIVLGNHRTSALSTYPFKTMFGFWPGAESGVDDHVDVGGVEIGSDVWIGVGAIILPGARIDHGAVIGAGAVVRGIVPAYTVTIGNPAKPQRTRFDAETVARLLQIAWWDWPRDKLDANMEAIASGDVERFIAMHLAEKSNATM